MGLFYDYRESGSGVSKNNESNRIITFFEIFTRKFWKLIGVNLLYVLFCLPVVTIGPATSAMMKVLKNYAIEKHSFVFEDFWKAFKENFFKSLVFFLIYGILLGGVVVGFFIYPEAAKTDDKFNVLMAVTAIIGVVLLMMSFFTFLMIPNINLGIKEIFKNSFILTVAAAKQSFLSLFLFLLILAIPAVLMAYVSFSFFILYALFPFSFAGFVVAFNLYPTIQKYVIDPYYSAKGRDNPEYDYLKPAGMEDVAVFEDKGGEEAPIVKASSKGKNKKTIS